MSSGFSYPKPIFDSPVYNPAFYLTLDASGYLTYDYAQTLYLDKNDYRLTYVTGITPGTATQGVALVPGTNNDVGGIGALSCSSLLVGGSAISAPPAYVVGITEGIAANSKALVLNSTGSITGINSLSATSLTGTLQTAAQGNITSIGALTGLTIAGDLNFTGVARSISGLSSLTATNITGTLTTASQTAITAVGILQNLMLNSRGTGIDTPNLKFGGVNLDYSLYINIAQGSAGVSKAVVLNSSKDFNGIRDLTCSGTVTGSTSMATPTLTCDTISKSGTQTMSATTLNINPTTLQLRGVAITSSAAELNTLSGVVAGSASNSKALILNSSGSITGINALSATSV
ncbi:hypothetical protein PC110_g21537 [Phytophthora cactorum]|uniref:Uncharacterized protein n=1 Tax=Phytophthora cactorum TaxID=29920 RepID=A0A329RC69_9STRA|nr:hypothetical protein PC110_g21537 [Phytophthora cactorum]